MEQQQQLHRSVLDGIERLEPQNKRRPLVVYGYNKPPVDRQSLEHLVNFLDNNDEVTSLVLDGIRLSDPSDGGVIVLRDLFSRSDTTLTKVALWNCVFDNAEEATRLIAAFQTNRTVTDLTLRTIRNLEGAALGACLSSLMQNMPQLRRLDCSRLRVEGVRAFHPALQANRTLRELNLSHCELGDEGIRLIADALVGNTNMDKLDIACNAITPVGLDDITRLIESTQLKKLGLNWNGIFYGNATLPFAHVLSRHQFLKELGLSECELGDGGIRLIADALAGNNTTMEVLDIHQNGITSVGLADITRLLVSTRLKSINLAGNHGVFDDEDATQHFVSTLQHKNSSVQELPEINQHNFSGDEGSKFATFAIICNSLTRNQQLNRVNLLLAPLPQQQQQRNAGTMMLKTWHKAITKFAMIPNNAGASAIFKLFTARPQLLEKRLKRPAAPAAAYANVASAASDACFSQEQKRRRRL